MKPLTAVLTAMLLMTSPIAAQTPDQDHKAHHPDGTGQQRQEAPQAPKVQAPSNMPMEKMMQNMPEHCRTMMDQNKPSDQSKSMDCKMMQDKAKDMPMMKK